VRRCKRAQKLSSKREDIKKEGQFGSPKGCKIFQVGRRGKGFGRGRLGGELKLTKENRVTFSGEGKSGGAGNDVNFEK